MKSTKIWAFALVAMFVISIPAVFAEVMVDASTDSDAVEVTAAATTDTDASTDDASVSVSNNAKAGLRAATLRTEVKAELGELRERLVGLKNARVHVKSEIAQSKLALNEARVELHASVKKSKECKGDDSEACAEVRLETKLKAQQTLLVAADHVLDVLIKIKDQTTQNDGLTAEQKAELIADIDAKIADVQEARATVAALDESSTKEELRDATKTIKDAWKESRASIKKRAGQLAYGELKAVVDAVARMSSRLDATIARFDEKGVDVSSVETLKVQFNAELAEAKYNLDAAAEAYAGITATNVDAKSADVRKHMNEARDALKEAHATLRDIAQELRSLAKDTRVEARAEAKASRNKTVEDSDNETESEDAEDSDDADKDSDDADDSDDDENESNETETD